MDSSATACSTQPAYAEGKLSLRPLARRLVLIRHAKAVEDDIDGDHARGLSERGKADAGQLGEWLKGQALVPDLVLCSTAQRTRETLAAIAAALGNLPAILADKLYLATTGEMLAHIQATDDAVKTLALIGHNPGVHALAASLVEEYARAEDADRLLLKFPTSTCAVMDFAVGSWKDVAQHSSQLLLLR